MSEKYKLTIMKELTIEEKARAYNEALEKAKRLYEKGTITESLCHIFPELKESEVSNEDEKIRRAIIEGLKEMKSSFHTISSIKIDDAIAWIEKQGESKIDDNTEPKDYNSIDPHFSKPIDKIEPKFHEGDWISSYYTNYRVTAINSKGYVVEDTDGNKINILFENEKFHHLFTIADAKDGDILVDMHGNIGIFQEYEDVFWHSYIYLGCDGTLRGFSIGGSHEQTDTHPATKEQSDNIMKAITDAGYAFDFEKKELKKLSKNLLNGHQLMNKWKLFMT